jgi:hypothetical protein
MAGAADVADALVAFDEDLAVHVLQLVCRELGAPDGLDAARMGAFLASLQVGEETTKTTVEWKAGFAHVERLRTLGVALAERLAGPAA